jgi:hypothetical protein
LANLRVTPVTAALEQAKPDLRVTPAIVALERAKPDLRVTPVTAALERAKVDLRVTPAIVALERAKPDLRVTPVTAALERAKVDLRVTPAIVALEQARPDLQVTPATAALERAKADLPWRGNRTRNSAINGAAMSARPVRIMLMGAAVILSTIAPVPTFAESEQTEWNVQDLYKYCKGVQGSLGKVFCLEFVSSAARPVFTNGLTLKDTKSPPDLGTRSIPSACPKLFVSNDAMVEAFSEWANQHLENWSANAQTGVMQAMHDTWPCL